MMICGSLGWNNDCCFTSFCQSLFERLMNVYKDDHVLSNVKNFRLAHPDKGLTEVMFFTSQ
mgnify:CR=1 FL=1